MYIGFVQTVPEPPQTVVPYDTRIMCGRIQKSAYIGGMDAAVPGLSPSLPPEKVQFSAVNCGGDDST